MKNYSKLLTVAALAAAFTASAHAEAISLAGNGDLILGIYATGGTGSGNTLQINLGEFTRFATFNGATFGISELSLTDLNNFGAGGAFARSTVSWGVVGSVGTSTYTSTGTGLLTTRNTLFATSTGSLNSGSINAQGGANPTIGGVYNSLVNGTATGNSVSSSYVASDSFSWAGLQALSAPLDFGFFTSSVTSTADVPSLALYELLPSNATAGTFTETGIIAANKGVPRLLGNFNLASNGTLTYTAAAIPEPSTYAAIAGALVLGVVAYRRRRAVKA
jgi:hypothetical protein